MSEHPFTQIGSAEPNIPDDPFVDPSYEPATSSSSPIDYLCDTRGRRVTTDGSRVPAGWSRP